MSRQLAAVQSIQLKILTASQASDPPAAQDQAQRGPGTARGRGRAPPRPRKCHLPTLECGELRVWGPHITAPHGTEGYRCITCARIANHKGAGYAFRTLPYSGRCGLGGPPRPCRPRPKWNQANEARWRRQGEGGHQAVRYNSSQRDGRWLCMRCGLHYVRFCDLRTKRCTGAPVSQAATKAIADALVGGPFTRRKVHAFAKHPSGSRPGATGARLPSDRIVLDPSVPKPPGPTVSQAQVEAPADLGGTPGGEPARGAPYCWRTDPGGAGHSPGTRGPPWHSHWAWRRRACVLGPRRCPLWP